MAQVSNCSDLGGEESLTMLQGTTDFPMDVYPENETNSMYGVDALSLERTHLIKKIGNTPPSEVQRSLLSISEQKVMSDLKPALHTHASRKLLHTLDYGICSIDTRIITRCITIMNWGGSSITCGLYAYDKLITCPRLVKVAAHSASTVEIAFLSSLTKSRGNYTSVIEVACQGFDNIAIKVTAFVGSPVYVPVWENGNLRCYNHSFF